MMGTGGGGGNSPSGESGPGRLEVKGVDFKTDSRGLCLGIGWSAISEKASFPYSSSKSISINWYVKGKVDLVLFVEGIGTIGTWEVVEQHGTQPVYIDRYYQMENGPYLSLLVWQLALLFSLFLSVVLCVKAISEKNNNLLIAGGLSFFIPFFITYPYWVFWLVEKIKKAKN